MADRSSTVDGAGCLGRTLTTLGILWIGFVVLGGLGVLSELGWSGGFAAGFGGSILPGLLLLVAGRAIRRRAHETSGRVPTASTPPVLPDRPVPPFTPPRPAQKAPIPAPKDVSPTPEPVVEPPPPPVEPTAETRDEKSKRLAEAFSRLEDSQDQRSAFRPKTSQEMIDEAKKRWAQRR